MMEGPITLPNGCGLFWRKNEAGGRTYYTDECSVGHIVWDTATTDLSTLLAAIVQEETLLRKEEYHARLAHSKADSATRVQSEGRLRGRAPTVHKDDSGESGEVI